MCLVGHERFVADKFLSDLYGEGECREFFRCIVKDFETLDTIKVNVKI